MKGVILAGGEATRLYPLTKVISKHCLPIYNKPMVYYPIESLISCGITDILIVCNTKHMCQYIDLLKDGDFKECDFTFKDQTNAGGIAEAIALSEDFVDGDDVAVILGDNIFLSELVSSIDRFNSISGECAHINTICSKSPQHYGVLHKTKDGGLWITEKPCEYLSSNVVCGFYIYSNDVYDKIRTLGYSDRGELEVTDLNNIYAASGNLICTPLADPWFDCGESIDALCDISNYIKRRSDDYRNGR